MRKFIEVLGWFLTKLFYFLAITSLFFAFIRLCVFMGDVRHAIHPEDYMIHHGPLLVILMLSDFLLAFVLTLLGKGIHDLLKEEIAKKYAATKESKKNKKGLEKGSLAAVERNFIGVIVSTLLAIAISLLLKSESVTFVLYAPLGIAALIIASSVYIHVRKE